MPRRTFGQYLRELRGDLSQQAVESKSKRVSRRGLSREYLSLLERGERGVPGPEILLVLAKLYGVPFKDMALAAQEEMTHHGVTVKAKPPDQAEVLMGLYQDLDEAGRETLVAQARFLLSRQRTGRG